MASRWPGRNSAWPKRASPDSSETVWADTSEREEASSPFAATPLMKEVAPRADSSAMSGDSSFACFLRAYARGQASTTPRTIGVVNAPIRVILWGFRDFVGMGALFDGRDDTGL